MAKPKTNYEAQERVVSALWEFAAKQHAIDPAKPITTSGSGVPMDLAAVRAAMEEILDAFGYTVMEID